jgi:hypothetical protein
MTDLIPFHNRSGETIPGFAVMTCLHDGETGGASITNSQYVLDMYKPAEDYHRQYFINGATPVADDKFGCCTRGVFVEAALDSGDTTPGKSWGPKPDEWKLFPDRPGFLLLSQETGDSELRRALVWQQPVTQVRGKLDDALTYLGHATLSIWCGPPDGRTDSGFNVEVYDDVLDSGRQFTSGSLVVATFHDGHWFVTAVDNCSSSG